MTGKPAAGVTTRPAAGLAAAPGLPDYTDVARPEWTDYNGHLSEAYYVLVFGFATDRMMELVGLDERYRAETGGSLYTVEAHVRYLREVRGQAALRVSTTVVSVGAKKVRFCHQMYVGDDTCVATEELLAVHVRDGHAADFPGRAAHRFRQLVRPAPDFAGRAIS
jgi:acyl-CoA thioester hydrolase